MVSDEWLKENFCTLYNYFYQELHDMDNIGTELDLPEFGCLGTGCPVKAMCKGKATCKERYTSGRDL
eukprot:8457001-Ditylum_brightwellii.AAC.1